MRSSVNWRPRLAETLEAATRGRGIASASVIDRAGGAPQTAWVPDAPNEPRFLAYSITKTFTAVLVLRLREEGKLSLEDPLAKWFPEIERADRISVRQLLNHTSGVPDYGGNPAYHGDVRVSPSKPWSFARFAAETFDKGLLFAPGDGWAYSNPGFMLLKRILEEVSGVPYRTLVSEYVTDPLGLRETSVAESLQDLSSLAPGTSTLLSPNGNACDVRSRYHPGWVSHGVIASTASDLVRFADRLFHGSLLTADSRGQMLRLVALPVSPVEATKESGLPVGQASYGLGLMGDPASPWGLLVGHNGGGPCYSASLFHAFDIGGVSVCAMGAIEEGFSAEDIVREILESIADLDPHPEVR